MTITNYSELVQQIQDYALRMDAPIDVFIGLLESDIAPLLIHYRAEKQTNISIPSTNIITIPADVIKMRAIIVDGEVATPISIFDNKLYPNQITYYTSANKINFNSKKTISKATLVYHSRIPSLTALAPTNWLLEYFPNVYLYGILSKLYVWARDDAGAAQVNPLLAQSIQQVIEDNKQFVEITNPIPQEATEW